MTITEDEMKRIKAGPNLCRVILKSNKFASRVEAVLKITSRDALSHLSKPRHNFALLCKAIYFLMFRSSALISVWIPHSVFAEPSLFWRF